MSKKKVYTGFLMNNNQFIKDFRTWLKQQVLENKQDLVGSEVYPKINLKKFCEVADMLKGNPISAGKCFLHEGGIVENVVDNQVMINCRKGKFYLDIRDIKKS